MRILLTRLGMLGDTLGAYSIVPLLKKQFGDDIEIDWIIRPGFQSLFQNDPCVKNVYCLKSRKWFYQLFFYFKNEFKPYDLIINLDSRGCNTLLKWIPAKQKLGAPFQNVAIPPLIHLFTLHQYLCRRFLKITDDNQSYLPELWGSPATDVKKKFGLSRPYLVLALATSHIDSKRKYLAYRNWSLSAWCEFIEKAKALPFDLILVGTASDKKIIEAQITFPEGIINLMGKTSIPELITVVREASGVVTCDTGVLHVASAVKTPIFALLGPSDPLRHGPYPIDEKMHTVIRSGIACSPCQHTPAHKLCPSNVCMQTILPEQVCSIIKNRLEIQ